MTKMDQFVRSFQPIFHVDKAKLHLEGTFTSDPKAVLFSSFYYEGCSSGSILTFKYATGLSDFLY